MVNSSSKNCKSIGSFEIFGISSAGILSSFFAILSASKLLNHG